MANGASLTVERAALLPALAAAAKVTAKTSTIPILQNLLLSAGSDGLRITATDLDIQLTQRVAATVAVSGDFTVWADKFHDFVRRLPDGAQLTIEQSDLDGSAAVRSGRTKAKLLTLPAQDYPKLGEGGHVDLEIGLQASTLARLLAKTEFAISSEETRYYLNGTYLHVTAGDEGAALRAVATDGHRLARLETIKGEGLAEAMPGIIVPRKAVTELRRLCDGAPEAHLSIDVSRSQLRVATGDTEFVTKLIDGTFPDYQRVIPSGNTRVANFGVASLVASLARVMVMSTEKGKGVRLSLNPDKAELSVNSPDSGSISDELEVEYEGGPFEIGFNGKYLTELLAQIDGDTVTALLGPNAGCPTIWRSKAPSDALFVLMPMRFAG